MRSRVPTTTEREPDAEQEEVESQSRPDPFDVSHIRDGGTAVLTEQMMRAESDPEFFEAEFLKRSRTTAKGALKRPDYNPASIELSDAEREQLQELARAKSLAVAQAKQFAYLARYAATLDLVRRDHCIYHPNEQVNGTPLIDEWLRKHNLERGPDILISFVPGPDRNSGRILVISRAEYPAPFAALEAETEVKRHHNLAMKQFFAGAYSRRGMRYSSW